MTVSALDMLRQLRERLDDNGFVPMVNRADREIFWLISDIEAEVATLQRELEVARALRART